MQNRGRFQYNHAAAQKGTALILHNNIKDKSVNNLSVCDKCYGLFSKQQAYRHNCPAAKGQVQSTPLQLATANDGLIKDVSKKFSRPLHRILVNQDSLLTGRITEYFSSKRVTSENEKHIRSELNIVCKTILEFRKLTGNQSAKTIDLIDPQNFYQTVEAVKIVAQYSEDTVASPSSAAKIGRSLVQ